MTDRWCAAAMTAIGLAACGTQPSPPVGSAPLRESSEINPARIDRVRADLPTGYETAALGGPVSPVSLWGYGSEWSVDPPRCAALADPVGAAPATGWSASGPGGIVYAAVAAAPGAVDPGVVAECARWTVTGGRTTGDVTLSPAPAIEDATTVSMATSSTTVVEGGTHTRSHADTAVAYLGDHVAFVTVVTDPGAPNPQLGGDFAAELIGKTVSALRG